MDVPSFIIFHIGAFYTLLCYSIDVQCYSVLETSGEKTCALFLVILEKATVDQLKR